MNIEVEVLASDTGRRSTHVVSGQAPIVIGRARDCNLALEHELVSRKHAVVRVGEEALRVEDTSRNGTLAGGLVLRKTVTEIPWGAPIGIGLFELTFRPARADGELDSAAPRPTRRHLKTPVTIVGPMEEVSNDLRQLLAPVQPYLDDARISQVLINGPETIYIECDGQLELTPARFAGSEAILRLLRRVARLSGERLDEQRPILQARLPDGCHFQAVAAPAARGGPYVTIRRPSNEVFDGERLIEVGSLTRFALDTLRALIAAKQNLIICGGAGSGKMSLLRALSGHVPEAERVGVIEHSKEVRLEHPHAFYLAARSADSRELFRASLRLRPDRLVIGEIREPMVLDVLEALSGRSASLSTLSATSPRDALTRLETMALSLDPELSLPGLRLRIGSGVNFILQTAQLGDGSRKVTHLTEVLGYDVASGRYRLQDVFVRKYSGSDAAGMIESELVPTALPGWVETP